MLRRYRRGKRKDIGFGYLSIAYVIVAFLIPYMLVRVSVDCDEGLPLD